MFPQRSFVHHLNHGFEKEKKGKYGGLGRNLPPTIFHLYIGSDIYVIYKEIQDLLHIIIARRNGHISFGSFAHIQRNQSMLNDCYA